MSFSPTIIIVNYNAGAMLAACVHSLLKQTHQDFRAVIVDNASHDDSLAQLPQDARVSVIRNADNAGFAKANNQVGLLAESEWIITLNPDTEVANNWLQQLASAVVRYPDIDMFGCIQLDAKQPEYADGLGDEYFCTGVAWRKGHAALKPALIQDEKVFGPCAAAAMYRTSIFKELGGFAEDFFCYTEDVDLAFRFHLHGSEAMQIADAVVYHHGYAISGAKSEFTLYHCTRNMVWAYFRCMPLVLLLITLPLHLAMQIFMLIWAKKRNYFPPVKRGIVDAWKGLPKILQQRAHIQANRKASTLHIASQMIWNPLQIVSWRKRVAGRDARRGQ